MNLPTKLIFILASPILLVPLIQLLIAVKNYLSTGIFEVNLLTLILSVFFYVLLLIIFTIEYRINRYQLGFWGKIYKITLVAKLIVNKKMFESETTSKGGKKDTKITYYPRIYIKFGKSGFKLFLPLDGNKFQKQFQDSTFSRELVMATRSTISDETSEDGFIVHEFLSFPELSRIGLDDMHITSDTIEIMKGFVWNFAKVPHMLVSVDTGFGKLFAKNCRKANSMIINKRLLNISKVQIQIDLYF